MSKRIKKQRLSELVALLSDNNCTKCSFFILHHGDERNFSFGTCILDLKTMKEAILCNKFENKK